MTRPLLPRMPWAPLGRVLACMEIDREPVGTTATTVARLLGTDYHQVVRWQRGGITVDKADRICQQIGRHPAEIWVEWCDLEAVA